MPLDDLCIKAKLFELGPLGGDKSARNHRSKYVIQTAAGWKPRSANAAWIGTAFVQDNAAAARKQWRGVADQARPRVPKLAKQTDDPDADVLAYMSFPAQHRAKIYSTNPIKWLGGEIKRRRDVVGIFPNEATVTRLIAALLLEQSDERVTQRVHCMTLDTITPRGDDLYASLPSIAP